MPNIIIKYASILSKLNSSPNKKYPMKPPSTIVKILAGIRTVNGILDAEANHATRAMPYSNNTK